jgi:hypothetical protein
MAMLQSSKLLLLVVTAAVSCTGAPDPPPPHAVSIEGGSFRVDGEPFFPLGFYYLWGSINTEYPPRTNTTTNASHWNGGCGAACNNADAWWRWYEETGFNTFVKGWMGTEYAEGYGEMLTYLHAHLNTTIMPILNVGDTQEIINAKTTRAKVDGAGRMAAQFRNSSFLTYYIQDEVGTVEPTASIAAAVKGNDSYHPTMSLFCGIQCGPQSWDAQVYSEIASAHDAFGIDSYTEYKHLHALPWNVTVDGSPKYVAHDVDRLRAVAAPGQPLIVTLQAVFLLIYECHPPAGPATDWPGCQQYRAITPDEAACEFFIAINHGATGVLWFTAEGTGVTPQNTSKIALIDEMPELWERLGFLAKMMKNGLAAALLAPAPDTAGLFSATGSGGPGWWPIDVAIHIHGQDLVICAVNPERFAISNVVFDLSAQRVTPNATWVAGYYLCPEGERKCGYETDMREIRASPPARGVLPSNSFEDSFAPLATQHYVCKGCVGI